MTRAGSEERQANDGPSYSTLPRPHHVMMTHDRRGWLPVRIWQCLAHFFDVSTGFRAGRPPVHLHELVGTARWVTRGTPPVRGWKPALTSTGRGVADSGTYTAACQANSVTMTPIMASIHQPHHVREKT